LRVQREAGGRRRLANGILLVNGTISEHNHRSTMATSTVAYRLFPPAMLVAWFVRIDDFDRSKYFRVFAFTLIKQLGKAVRRTFVPQNNPHAG
jgi:hypothetical protein